MNQLTSVSVSLGMALALCLPSRPAQAQAKSPTETFLAYVATTQKAKSLDELLPYLEKEYRANLSGEPAEKKPVWLERLKDGDKRDIKVVKETLSGEKCTLETTATSKEGWPLKGKAFLVKEDGGWKIEAQVWATTGEPPAK